MVQASRRKYHYLYKTTCIITGRYYFGMHSTDDLDDGYLGSGKFLWNSIKKHGREFHRCEILGELFPDRESLKEAEADFVDDKKLQDPLCMNLIKGGGAWVGSPEGHRMSDEQRQKLSEALMGKNVGKHRTEETRRKIAEAMIGVKRTAATKALMSAAAKLRWEKRKAEGHHVSEETHRKLSIANRISQNRQDVKERKSRALMGREVSDETRAKLSLRLRQRKMTDEARKKISKAQRGIKKPPRTPEHCKKLSEVRKAYWEKKRMQRVGQQAFQATQAGQEAAGPLQARF